MEITRWLHNFWKKSPFNFTRFRTKIPSRKIHHTQKYIQKYISVWKNSFRFEISLNLYIFIQKNLWSYQSRRQKFTLFSIIPDLMLFKGRVTSRTLLDPPSLFLHLHTSYKSIVFPLLFVGPQFRKFSVKHFYCKIRNKFTLQKKAIIDTYHDTGFIGVSIY